MTQQNQQTQEILPYNPANILVSEKDIVNILETYGVEESFRDINMYRKAFVHKSYCTRKNENFVNGNINCPLNCIPLQEESNERLEFFGDSILNMVVADYLFERYPDENEGFLTRMRTKLVNGKMLAFLSEKIGFSKFILISKQIDDGGGRTNFNILEDTFEAFIAALYLDMGQKGLECSKAWIISVIESLIDFSELIKQNNNFKDMFLKYYQQCYNTMPKFFEMNVNNSNSNGKLHTICIKDSEGNIISIGKGSNKKDAENNAARQALTQYIDSGSNFVF
jgi:ribonuclease-3